MSAEAGMAEVAASLTNTQRECLDWACSFLPSVAPTEGSGIDRFIDDRAKTDVLNQCFNLGILDQRGIPCFDEFHIEVTPLGLAVRLHLQEQKDAR